MANASLSPSGEFGDECGVSGGLAVILAVAGTAVAVGVGGIAVAVGAGGRAGVAPGVMADLFVGPGVTIESGAAVKTGVAVAVMVGCGAEQANWDMRTRNRTPYNTLAMKPLYSCPETGQGAALSSIQARFIVLG